MDTTHSDERPAERSLVDFPTRRVWLGSALASAGLIGSGIARRIEERKFQERFEATRVPPFRLESIPLRFGSWRGERGELPEAIARAAGSTDNIIRKYTDTTTGVAVSALVIVGSGPLMIGHPPENCYVVGSGFIQTAGPQIRLVKRADGKPPVAFNVYLFERQTGGERIRAEVYYTWRINGRFTADKGNYKLLERISDVYKIQTERRLNATEAFNAPTDLPVASEYAHPTEIFLGQLVPAFDRLFDRESTRRDETATKEAQKQ